MPESQERLKTKQLTPCDSRPLYSQIKATGRWLVGSGDYGVNSMAIAAIDGRRHADRLVDSFNRMRLYPRMSGRGIANSEVDILYKQKLLTNECEEFHALRFMDLSRLYSNHFVPKFHDI